MAASRPRVKVPKSAAKGEVFQIKTLVTHKMETGLRKDKDGQPIPRDIVNTFTCDFNGKTVFTMKLEPAVSANPYIAFFQRATESGEYTFTWTDDTGESVSETKSIQVG